MLLSLLADEEAKAEELAKEAEEDEKSADKPLKGLPSRSNRSRDAVLAELLGASSGNDEARAGA